MIGHSFEICATRGVSFTFCRAVDVDDVSIHATHACNLALSERGARFVSHVTSVCG